MKAAQRIGTILTSCITLPILVVVVLWWIGSSTSTGVVQTLMQTHEHAFTIKVHCTPGTSFRGTYMIVTASGPQRTTHLASVRRIDLASSSIAERSFQHPYKSSKPEGTLSVEIWETGGSLLNQSSTSDSYGVAVAASSKF